MGVEANRPVKMAQQFTSMPERSPLDRVELSSCCASAVAAAGVKTTELCRGVNVEAEAKDQFAHALR